MSLLTSMSTTIVCPKLFFEGAHHTRVTWRGTFGQDKTLAFISVDYWPKFMSDVACREMLCLLDVEGSPQQCWALYFIICT